MQLAIRHGERAGRRYAGGDVPLWRAPGHASIGRRAPARCGGADANAIDARGWPLLIDAADRGDAEIVQALLGGGALVNGKTPTGVTALSAAVLKRHTSVVRALLAAGADVHVRDPAGETPILLAAKFEGSVTVEQPGGVVAGTPGPPPGARDSVQHDVSGRRGVPPRPSATRSRSSWRCCSRPGPIRTRRIVRGAPR